MKIKIKCPKCGEEISLVITNGEVTISEKNKEIELSQEEIKVILANKGIELG